jgi:hypothetical protein
LRLFYLETKLNDNINDGNKEKKMNKSDLINEVGKVVGTKKAARETVDCILSTITKN